MVSTFNSYARGVLDHLPLDAREALISAGTRVHLDHGQMVQSRGHTTSDMAIVLKGKLRMMTIGEDGTVLLMAILGPGQQINEVTMFAGAARTHDAEAVGDTELLTISPAVYRKVATQFPVIIEALLISNVQRVHQLVETLNDLRALPKAVVLARVLLKNARYQRGDSEVNHVEMELTQEDIAMFLGVSRAYLNKVIGQLCDLGLISLSYRKIRVLDLQALEDWIQDNLTYDPVEDFSEVPSADPT